MEQKEGVIRVERARPEETSLALDLLRHLYRELGEEAESIRFLDLDLMKRMMESGRTEILFARDPDGKPVGILTLTSCQSFYAGGEYGLIDEMYVEPAHRSHSVGTALLEAAKRIARERGWSRLDVTGPTEERWKRTIRFYERSGFVFTGPKLKFALRGF